MNGSTIYNPLQWSSAPYNKELDTGEILFFMDMGSENNVYVNGGTYWTYHFNSSSTTYRLADGKIYGTNENMKTIVSETDINFYDIQ